MNLPERQQADIRATINARKRDLHACYDEARWRSTGATGRIEIRFVIDEAGHVASSCVEQPALDDGVAVDCLLSRLRQLEFGPGARTTVTLPLVVISREK